MSAAASALAYPATIVQGRTACGPPHQHDGAAFSFRKRTERVDWRKVAALDIDQMARSLDFAVLQDNISNVAYCNIECEIDSRCCDPNYVKLFRLAQFIIDYLLHSQDYLSHMVVTLEGRCQDYADELQKQRITSQAVEQELKIAKEEARKFRKLLCAQREEANHHQCPFCCKMFLNIDYLQSHIRRRHSSPPAPLPVAGLVPPCTDKYLEEEIHALKKCLGEREQQLQQEQQHRSEMLRDEMEQWKNMHKQDQQKQLDEVRTAFVVQLQDVCKRAAAAEQCIDLLQKQMNNSSVPMQPVARDDAAAVLKEQRREFCKLKKHLTELVESAVCHQLKEQKEDLQKKINVIFKEHNEELGKLNSLVQEKMCHVEPVPVQDDLLEAICEKTRVQEKLLRQQQRRLRRIHCEQVKQQQLQQQQCQPSAPQPQPNVDAKPELRCREKKKLRRCRRYLCRTIRPRHYLHCHPFKSRYVLSVSGSDSCSGKARSTIVQNSSDCTVAEKHRSLVRGLRHELSSLLSEKLQSHGLLPSTKSITKLALKEKLSEMELDRKLFQQQYPNFMHFRALCEQKLEKLARKSLSLGIPMSIDPVRNENAYSCSVSPEMELVKDADHVQRGHLLLRDRIIHAVSEPEDLQEGRKRFHKIAKSLLSLPQSKRSTLRIANNSSSDNADLSTQEGDRELKHKQNSRCEKFLKPLPILEVKHKQDLGTSLSDIERQNFILCHYFVSENKILCNWLLKSKFL